MLISRATDESFQSSACELRSARMGTELMAPLLYSLLRSVRAERVLEIGAGLTTLYLAKALADNLQDVRHEQSVLPLKQRAYSPAWEAGKAGSLGDERARLRWLEAEPALADPSYYDQDYVPSCITIDDATSPFSTSAKVEQALRRAGLDGFVQWRRIDFRDAVKDFVAAGRMFDFVWFDCGGAQEYRDFLNRFWDLVEPDGGMIVLHYTLTVPRHEAVLEEFLRSGCEGQRGRFELLSLREPHKLMQNSATLIRRCDVPAPNFPLTRPVSLERSSP